MARKRQRPSSTTRAPRDASVIASPFPDFLRLRPLSTHPRSGHTLTEIEDRRTFNPGRSPSRTPRQIARVLMALPKVQGKRSSREVYSFKLPKQTAVCVRREIRKQVIHAKGAAGTKVRRPRRNALSRISCRRK